MTARVLLVDDLELNRKLLAESLSQEYYEVMQATNGAEALAAAVAHQPDVILLDVMMPGMDGYEVCRRLKEDPATGHIPVVFLSALDERIDRLRGLELGAEDFLSKPFDTLQLLARMRSLRRMKTILDELRGREASGRRIGVIEGAERRDAGIGGRVLVIDDSARQARQIAAALQGAHEVFFADAQGLSGLDLVIISLASKSFDALRVVAHLGAQEAFRHLPILVACDADDGVRALRALDLGAQDLIHRPIDVDELQARVRTLVARKRSIDAMRASLDKSMELAVTDQLTGLYNRRYLMGQLQALSHRALRGGEPVSLIIADIDHFKKINDTHGHGVGDEVLKEFAARLASNFRPVDIACRFGGEEFVIVMPATRGDYACLVADRLRRHVAGAPFTAEGGAKRLDVTVSLGVVATEGPHDTADVLLRRADEALYQAKEQGRNRVIAAASSAAA
jgi:two-component system cell cycle response regulator